MSEIETPTTDHRWGGEGRDLKAKQIMQTLRHFSGRDLSAALWLDFSCSSGGIAYFAGPNLLFPIEPHVFWPFVHWLPRGLAVRLMRALGSRKVLDANSASWWRLHAWFDGFEVSNALPYFMHHALAQGRKGWRFKPLYAIPSRLLDRLSFASPGFVFILQRPYPPHHG